MPELNRMWWDADPGRCSSGRRVRGPLTAAAMSLKRIGWKWPDPFTFTDDFGVTLNGTSYSPCHMGSLLQAACIRSLERKAMQQIHDGIPLDSHFDHHE